MYIYIQTPHDVAFTVANDRNKQPNLLEPSTCTNVKPFLPSLLVPLHPQTTKPPNPIITSPPPPPPGLGERDQRQRQHHLFTSPHLQSFHSKLSSHRRTASWSMHSPIGMPPGASPPSLLPSQTVRPPTTPTEPVPPPPTTTRSYLHLPPLLPSSTSPRALSVSSYRG